MTAPRRVLAVVLGLAVLAVILLTQRGLRLDSSPDTLIAEQHHGRRLYARAQRIFGSDRLLVIGLRTREVFAPDFLVRLRLLTGRLERLPGVERVISLTNVPTIENKDGVIEVKNLIPTEASAAELGDIARRALDHRLLRRNLLSEDGRTTALNIFLAPTANVAVAEEIYQMARTVAGADEVYVAGEPIMEYRGWRSMASDLLRLLPISLGLVVMVFVLTFGRLRGVILPLGVVVFSVILTLAIMSIAGRPLTIATLTLPVVLMAVASTYAIHVLHSCSHIEGVSRIETGVSGRRGPHVLTDAMASAQERNIGTRGGADALAAMSLSEWRHRVRQALGVIGWPVILSATTTMAGFGSLLFTGIPTSRDLGLFAALGVGIAAVLALVFVPAVLALRPPRARPVVAPPPMASRMMHLARGIARITTKRRPTIYGAVLVATMASVVGATRIEVTTDYLRFHPTHSELHRAARFLHRELAGVASFHFLVDAGRRGALERPETLSRMVELQRQIEAQPGIDTTFSIADLVIEVNQALAPHDPNRARIPDNRERLQNIFADLLSQDEMAEHLMNRERSQAVILVRSNLFDSKEMTKVLAGIDRWARANLREMTVHPTGLFVLLNQTADDVARQQSHSLTVALVLIWLMMIALFRSVQGATLALVPNALSIIFFFGILGWTRIPLDINTSLVASIVLGLAVDNAVHLLWRYRKERQREIEPPLALHRALTEVGPPILVANATLIVAFAIFGLSTFPPIRMEGVLSAMTVVVSAIANLVVLPALLVHPVLGLNDLRG